MSSGRVILESQGSQGMFGNFRSKKVREFEKWVWKNIVINSNMYLIFFIFFRGKKSKT